MSDPTLPPLDQQCGTCEGSREATNPGYAEWEHAYDAAFAEWKAANPDQAMWWRWQQSYECREMERACPSEVMPCPDCDGTGALLTEAGQALLAFLDRHRNLSAVRNHLRAVDRAVNSLLITSGHA